jgi:HEAT repeat protein
VLSEITSCAAAYVGTDNVLIRWAAVTALEHLLPLRATDHALATLVCHASDSRPDVRRAVLAVLATLGVDAIEYRAVVFAALSDVDTHVRNTAVNTLQCFNDSVRAATGTANDEPAPRNVNGAHMAALASDIVALIDDAADDAIVTTAVAALAKIAPFARVHVGRAASMLNHKDALVRRSALMILAEAGDAAASLALDVAACLCDPVDRVRQAAVLALKTLGQNAFGAAERGHQPLPAPRTRSLARRRHLSPIMQHPSSSYRVALLLQWWSSSHTPTATSAPLQSTPSPISRTASTSAAASSGSTCSLAVRPVRW